MSAGNVNPYSLFISDLHLCQSRPAITSQFLEFLDNSARHADALYILGDFFEYWAGDDDLEDPAHQAVLNGLSRLHQHGISIYLMHGNRDFLLGSLFSEKTGVQLLADPTVISLYSQQILLTHGDALCTDDIAYQDFRAQVRQPAWQQQFLQLPLQARKAQIEALRQRSELEKSHKSESIMDVNADAVAQLLKEYDYPPILIHGHTHRPAKHMIHIDDHITERWVLGDWYEQGSCLKVDAKGCIQSICLNN